MFKNPLVVGYKGEIGKFILQGLLNTMPKATNILCYDINETEEEKVARNMKADVIFLCVPIEETKNWIKKYEGQLNKDAIIIEQTSLKFGFYEGLKHKHNIMHMHLLFRPSGTPNLNDRRIAFVKNKSCLVWIVSLIVSMCGITQENVILYNSISAHDKDMAKQQALLHRAIYCLKQVIDRGKGKTFIGGKINELANRIGLIDPKLFVKMQNNKFVPNAIKQFEKEMKRFDKIYKLCYNIKKGDINE